MARMLEVARQIHARHPAPAQFALNVVPSAEHVGERHVRHLGEQGAELHRGVVIEQLRVPLAFGDQALQLGALRRVVPAQFIEQCSPSFHWRIKHGVNKRRQGSPVVWQQRRSLFGVDGR